MSKDKANERISGVEGNQNDKKSNKKWIIIILICILVGVIVYLLTRADSKPNNVVSPDNVDQVISQMEEDRTPEGSYEVSMNTDWEFESGDSVSSNAFVENSPSNQHTVYFTITLADSDDVIYTSPYLEVGSVLREIKLDTVLDPGVYESVITYHLVDDEQEEISSVSLYIQITIKQ